MILQKKKVEKYILISKRERNRVLYIISATCRYGPYFFRKQGKWAMRVFFWFFGFFFFSLVNMNVIY